MRITRFKSALGLASIAAMAGLSMAPALASSSSTGAEHDTFRLQLLSFNDYHGYLEAPTGGDATLSESLDPTGTEVGGATYLATMLSELRAGADNTLTVAAGDLIGGSPFLSGLFHDEPSVDTLDAMGLDVSSVGNHEFDEGLTELVRMQFGGCHPIDGCYFPGEPYDGADFPWLAANVAYTKTGKPILTPTWVEQVQGVKIGFIGMTLEGTPELVAQRGIQGLTFQDEVDTANAYAARLSAYGAETIIVLLHEGGLNAGTYDACEGLSGPILSIAEQLDPAIDMVVTGHTHQPYVCDIPDPSGAPRMVTSASSFGRVVTESWLTIDRATGDVVRDQTTSVNHLVTHDLAEDPTVGAIVDRWKELAAPVANRVIGSISEDITRSETRDSESALANLIADAQLAATAEESIGGAQIALMNPGGVRADLTVDGIAGGEAPGEVTYGEAFTVQPFGNLLVTMDLTGEQLDAVLEQQYIADRSRPQLILGVSEGLTFDWSESAPEGEKVSNLALAGAPIDPAATYRVTVNNFLADGGDSFTVFTQGTNRLGGGDDLTAFIDYIGLNSPVAAAPTDRINEVP